MKICFIGLGSIGKRHIKNLVSALNKRKIEYVIDAVRSSKSPLDESVQQLIHNSYYSIEELADDYDIVFITNPTFKHYDTLKQVISKTKHIFLEKPVFSSLDIDMDRLTYKKDSVYYVACPLRYHPVVQFVKDYVRDHQVFSVRSICSSYLPEWRKDIDYRKNYSASKQQGGGVSLDLIHEWDYIKYIFGMPLKVLNLKQKCSDLEITSEDLSIYMAQYTDKLIEVHLDYFGRKTVREVTLYTKREVVTADIVHNTIYKSNQKEEKIVLESEDMYINEMNYFLDCILLGTKNENDIREAYETLKIAIGEEEA